MSTELVTIIAIVMFLGGTVAVVIFAFYYDYKKRQLQSQEILAAIEKGIEVPFPPAKPKSCRNRGLIWSAVGIALFVAIWVSSGEFTGAVWGVVPLAVGIAFLLIAYFEKKEKGAQAAGC